MDRADFATACLVLLDFLILLGLVSQVFGHGLILFVVSQAFGLAIIFDSSRCTLASRYETSGESTSLSLNIAASAKRTTAVNTRIVFIAAIFKMALYLTSAPK